MNDRTARLAEFDRRRAETMVTVVINGRKAAEMIGLQIVAEALSHVVLSLDRARRNSSRISKRLRKRIERAHSLIVNITMDVAGDLSDAVTR